MSLVKLIGISKVFKGALSNSKSTALFDINLEVKEGEIICLLGPSGSGKTTLLRIIAGIESETSGTIELNGIPINNVNARERQIGFVFQNTDAVYPHLTVFENVAFPLKLKLRKEKSVSVINSVKEILQKVDLSFHSQNYPHELSGGEKQRIALARALVYKPKVLLLDEPLSSLDNILKKEILDLIKNLHEQFNTTILYVTHDEREAIEIADRIVILSEGKILQHGTVQNILENPESSKVAKIIGGWNVLSAHYSIEGDKYYLSINDTIYEWPNLGFTTNKEIEIGLPISMVELSKDKSGSKSNFCILSTVYKVINYQDRGVIEVSIGHQRVRIEKEITALNHFKKDEQVFLLINKKAIKFWK